MPDHKSPSARRIAAAVDTEGDAVPSIYCPECDARRSVVDAYTNSVAVLIDMECGHRRTEVKA